MEKLPRDVSQLLNNIDYIYDYDEDSDWMGNCEVDFTYEKPNSRYEGMFSVFFTDEGYGMRGDKPDDIPESAAVVSAIMAFELAEIEYELPERLK